MSAQLPTGPSRREWPSEDSDALPASTVAWIDEQQQRYRQSRQPQAPPPIDEVDGDGGRERDLPELPPTPMVSAHSSGGASRSMSLSQHATVPSYAQPSVSRHTKDRSTSPARSRSSGVRPSYIDHLQQQQQYQQHHGGSSFQGTVPNLAFPNTPSTSSQQLLADPSPSISRAGDGVNLDNDDEQEEATDLLFGMSKRRRGRNNSQSSFGSSVLPVGYSSRAYRGLGGEGGSFPLRHGVSPVAAPAPQRYRNGSSRPSTGAGLNGSGARPSAAEVEGWLRTTHPPDAFATLGLASPPLPQEGGGFQTFAPPGRITKKPSGMTLSDAGSAARGRSGQGSTSGLSAGVMSAGAGDVRRRRKESSKRREGSGFAALQASLAATLGSPDPMTDPSHRKIDSIEEWRAKSSNMPSTRPGDPITSTDGGRPRRKSSARRDSEVSGLTGHKAPPLPTSPVITASRTLDSLAQLAGTSALSPPAHQRRRSSSKVPSVAPSATRSVLGVRSSAPLPDIFALSGHKSQEDTPIRRYVRWMSKEGLRGLLTPIALLVVLLVKWCIGRGGWSGQGIPPKFGDFEAQRHWLELTLHLPTSRWYFYDLDYWGLDYPPLTAWVSLACAFVANAIPAVRPGVAFFTSRGNESAAIATFMRASVVLLDFAVYVPAIALFLSRRLEGRGSRTYSIALLSILLQPALILVDNGHFQYNSVMLGFAAACFALLYTTLPNPSASDATSITGGRQDGKRTGRIIDLSRRLSYEYVLAAFLFCLSLAFKQMALYFAPAVFAVMLGRCIGLFQVDPERGVSLFCGLALCVVGTFGVLFSPWLTSVEQIGQVLRRIFPLARGLFEDKVANVWCFLTVLPIPQRYKLRNLLSITALARLSMVSTLVMILPACLMLYAAASETAKREMMVEDSKLVDEAVVRSRARRQSVSSAATGDDKAPASLSPIDMQRSTSQARSRSRKSGGGGRTASISGSVAGGRHGGGGGSIAGGAASDIQALLTASTSGSVIANPMDSLKRPSILLLRDSMPDHPVASTLPSPAAMMLPYGLISVSMAFFLFGFQTHEKSILLPLLPLTLLLGAKGDQWGGGSTAADWTWAVLGNNVGAFSIYPLLRKDGQQLQYAVLLVFWNWLVGNRFWKLNSADVGFGDAFSAIVQIGMLSLHTLELVLPFASPSLQARIWSRYPDLYPVLNVWLCTPVFFTLYIWATVRLWQVGFGCAIESVIWSGVGGGASVRKVKKDVKVV